MQIIVITSGSYPFGGAATNRHLSYLKGLVESGVKVTLLILQPDKAQSKLSNKQSGSYDGVEFEYVCWVSYKNKSIIRKIYYKVLSHYRAIQKLKLQKRNTKDNLILLLLITNPFEIVPYLIAKNTLRIPVFHERTEYPFLNANNFFKKLSLRFYLKCIVPGFDGIFVISNALAEFFAQFVRNKSQILHLPMTVDYERFAGNYDQIKQYGSYIAYCGSMYTDKDGVPDLISAFNIFCKSNADTTLVLIGDNEDRQRFKIIQDNIDSSPYNQRIFCTGYIARDQIPGYLRSATILALARPDNIQAQGGFPTKLGEYLATGKPIVITAVGEQTEYLTDGFSAYISPPGDPSAFSEKMLEAVNNPVKALQVGTEGKKIAMREYNYKIQAKKLLSFFQDAK